MSADDNMELEIVVVVFFVVVGGGGGGGGVYTPTVIKSNRKRPLPK